MNIAVAGLWHLGSVTAACLASVGYQVVGFDDNGEAVSALQMGRPPIFEPGLEDFVRAGVASGRLSFSANPTAVASADTLWVTYDTPVDENDQADVTFVIDRVIGLFPYLRPDALVLLSSQLPVGTTRHLESQYSHSYPTGAVTFAYSPENLRLGKAIEVFMQPYRIVVGVRPAAAKERISALLKPFTDQIEWMSVESAEMTKHALNVFFATSVTFANELATICERVGADAGEVERGLKSEARIGPRAYLRPGSAFAGGTLARDLSFLLERGQEERLTLPLLSGVQQSNDAHKLWPRRRLVELLGNLTARCITVLGLTYKPGTDTLRRSSAVEFCRWLHEQGAIVSAYDPAVKELPDGLRTVITLGKSPQAALQGAQAALIATEWPEFLSLRAEDFVRSMHTPIVLDPGRFLEGQLRTAAHIRYVIVGRPA